MLRRDVLEEVEKLISTYCSGCFLKTQNKKDSGKRFAHRFCITECTVGEKIKDYGEKLSTKESKKKIGEKRG